MVYLLRHSWLLTLTGLGHSFADTQINLLRGGDLVFTVDFGESLALCTLDLVGAASVLQRVLSTLVPYNYSFPAYLLLRSDDSTASSGSVELRLSSGDSGTSTTTLCLGANLSNLIPIVGHYGLL